MKKISKKKVMEMLGQIMADCTNGVCEASFHEASKLCYEVGFIYEPIKLISISCWYDVKLFQVTVKGKDGKFNLSGYDFSNDPDVMSFCETVISRAIKSQRNRDETLSK